jgi:alkyl hydroperoxide reductase subunit AhpF
MALLTASDQEALREELESMTNRVRLVFFTQTLNCETCDITKRILEEVKGLSEKLELQTFNYAIDREAVSRYGITRIPAIALERIEENGDGAGQGEASGKDFGIRFYGVPSGYEFMSLIGDILDVSHGDSGLGPESKSLIAKVQEPIHLQIFTTPT